MIGRLAHVATDDEMRRLYRWAKHSTWADLADDEADYVDRNRLFVLPADENGSAVMVHMSHEEYRRVSFHSGDLVRYTPRMAGGDGSAAPSIYSTLAGCIAILCRAGDEACAAQYRSGIFRHSDGVQLDYTTDRPLVTGVAIDPLSLLPRARDEARSAR